MDNSEDATADALAKFSQIIAIKQSQLFGPALAKRLTPAEKNAAWEAMADGVSKILPHCMNFAPLTEHEVDGVQLAFWDYMNGREVRFTVNDTQGYDFTVLHDGSQWLETQLSLDLLLLKILAIDYVPPHFRDHFERAQ